MPPGLDIADVHHRVGEEEKGVIGIPVLKI